MTAALANLSEELPQASHLQNIYLREFCCVCAFPVHVTSLFHLVMHIIDRRSKKQVAWIYARRIVASVKYLLSSPYLTNP